MLSTSMFPTRLKFSQVSPIFKKGNKAEISAYRPICLLTSFSKIFEKVIYNRLLQYTKENNIITSDQYGFKNNIQRNWLYLI
jgi:predicted restriction endonuclease